MRTMHSMGRPAVFTVLALSIAPAAHANVIFRGDLETGNISQFDSGTNMTAIRVQSPPTAPVRDGRYAARIELRNENTWPNGLRRVELGYTPAAASFAGSDRYYAFSMITSTDLPLVPSVTNSIAYFESGPDYHQIMVFNVTNGRVTFTHHYPRPGQTTAAGDLWNAPFEPARWHDFVLHVKWSVDPTVGFVEIWYDGAHVLPRTPVQTMYRDAAGRTYNNFFHSGLLHGNFDTTPQAVYLDRVLDGTTLGDVMLAGSTDGGIPDAGMRDASVADATVDSGQADAITDGDEAGWEDIVPAHDAVSNDTGTSAYDAGPGRDATAAHDATAIDEGSTPTHSGCGCRTTRGERAPGATLVAMALGAAMVRRRRVRGG